MKNAVALKRMITILTVMAMCVTLVFGLAACGGSNTSSGSATTTAVAGATTAAPAATAAPAEKPTIKYYFIAQTATPDELKLVQGEANKLVSDKIGANIELHTFTFADVTSKVPLMLSSGDDLDVVSNNGSFCSYTAEQQTGGLLALDNLLPKVTPNLWNKYDKNIWQATKIKGSIYMVPNYNPGVSYPGVWARKDLTDKYSFDWQNADSWEAWEPFYDQILKNEKGVTPILSSDQYWGRLWFPNYYGYDGLPGVSAPKGQALLGVKADDATRKVVALPFTDDYKAAVALARKWYQKGYFLKTPPTEDQMGILRKTGKFASFIVPFVGEWDTTAMANNEWSGKIILQCKIKGKKNIINTGSITGSGNGVAKVSKHPQEALKFIEQMHTNADLVNLLNFGIKGTDWEFKDELNKVVGMPNGVTADNIKYNPNTYWQFGDSTLQYYTSPTGKDVLSRVQDDIKDLSVYSPIMGFTPDPAPVKSQIAAVANMAQEYGEPLEKGLVDPNDGSKGLAVFQKKLKDAGIDDIVAEYQKQIDQWASENKK